MTKTLGLIGSGMIGGVLARLAVAAGLDVVLSNSRGPETLADLVAELGEHATAATPKDAAEADLVVATIPLRVHVDLSAAALADKTVIDTMNYYPERDGRIAALDTNEATSSELVQRHLKGSRVVKAFNNLSFFSLLDLARPTGDPERSALPIAADDPAAKTEVSQLLDILGYDAVDAGTLADSWRSEPNTPVYVQPYMPPRRSLEGLSQEDALRRLAEGPSTPVPAHRVRNLLDAAVRGPAGGLIPKPDRA